MVRAGLVAASAAVAAMVVAGCGGRSGDAELANSAGQSVAAPSGTVEAALVEGAPDGGVATLHVVIRGDAGDELFRSEQAYSTRHGVAIAWQDSGEVLWVLSSDVGTSRIEPDGDGWTQSFLGPQDRDDVPPEIDALR
ncbi:hypothetical protein [Actinotalea sp. C106]|uniref:hypothetical protein n=1 Tax=Actinotalea sp. C106 TaxID=2908644 RepID=UPI0020292D27|nr:hypothetical protein [Actinotalea sp. C106]